MADVSCYVAMWVSESGIGMAPVAADLQTERGMAEEVPILEVQVYNGWYRGLLVSWNTLAGICWRGGGDGGLSYHVVDGGTRDSWWVEAERTGRILGLGRVFLPEC